MEDALKFLLVAGIIIYGFVKQARKKTEDSAPTASGPGEIPVPDASNPLPENWGKRPHTAPATRPVTPQQSRPTPEPFIPSAHRKTAPRYTPHTPPPASQPSAAASGKNEEPAPDLNLQALEEVRKGIIWSEILQRKY